MPNINWMTKDVIKMEPNIDIKIWVRKWGKKPAG